MLLLLALPALATPPGPILEGFAVSGRDGAPTDARILVEANFSPTSTVVAGPGAPLPLEVEPLVGDGGGGQAVVALLPPGGGWAPGEAYTVAVADVGYYGSTAAGPIELAFTTGADPAAPPVDPEVLDVEVGGWTGETRYDRGCCRPTRPITFHVRNPQSDPWSAVELFGLFTDRGAPDRLAIGVGSGDHALTYAQWEEDGEVQPPCFAVVGVAADGEAGREVEVCVEGGVVRVDGAVVEATGCGCGQPRPGGALAALLGITLAARSCRSSRSRSAAGSAAPRSASAA